MDDARNAPTREDVVAAYRLLLGREPENEQVIAAHLTAADRTALIRRFVGSAEFRSRMAPPPASPPAPDGGVIGSLEMFAPTSWPSADGAHWVDALGVRTRCSLNTAFKGLAGRVVAQPDDVRLEWQALLDSLAAARDQFCMIELGAGHGPWLARAGVAWLRRYPTRELMLVGVEAEPRHFEYLTQHLTDNDIPEAYRQLVHAAVSAEDGVAEFEVAGQPALDWGTRLVGGPQPAGLPRIDNADRIRVQTVTLKTLAAGLGLIDLVHVDIQGAEVPVLRASHDALRDQVRRLVIGTHGREIEAQVIDLLVPLGFQLCDEQACRYRLDGSLPILVADGTQVWINRTLAES